MNPDTILALLQTSACESEENSDVNYLNRKNYSTIFKLILLF